MLNNESQVRLTIKLEGRLGAKASNSTSKKERYKAAKAARYGKKWRFEEYHIPAVQACSQSTTLSSECVAHFISDDGKPVRFNNRLVTPSDWKKLNRVERLEMNLQISADNLSGHEHTKYSYEVLN